MTVARHRQKRRPVVAIVFIACCSMAGSLFAEPVSPTVLAGLESEKPRVRIGAVVAIAKSDDENARRYLEGMLRDSDDTVRAAACEQLMKRGDPTALPAVRALVDDKSALVKKIANKAIAALEKAAKKSGVVVPPGKLVLADISDATDGSEKAAPGIVERLREGVKAALTTETRVPLDVRDTKQKDGFGLKLRIRSIDESVQDGVTIVSVKCEMTLVKLPENALRLQSTATAGAGIEGTLTDRDRAELQRDAVDACAPELAKDFIEYALTRVR
jgi:hypothetical protein